MTVQAVENREIAPPITAIVLTYCNLEEYEYTIKSILIQDYPRIELLISDDGSPDFQRYKQCNEKYIEQNKTECLKTYTVYTLPQNEGTVKNLNQAIRKAQGKYVAVIAMGDRYADKNVFSEYINAMQQSCKRMAVSRSQLVTKEHVFLTKVRPNNFWQKKLKKMSAEQLFELTLSTMMIHPVGMCFERSLFEEIGPVDERIRLVEDLPWMIAVTQNGYVPHFIDRVMTHYVVGGISGKITYNPAFFDDLRIAIQVSRVPYDHRYGMLQPLYNWLHMHRYVDYAQTYRKEKTQGKSLLKRLTAMIKLGMVAVALWFFPVHPHRKRGK